MKHDIENNNDCGRDDVIAVSRRLAQEMGISKGAGPEYLLAGACRQLQRSQALACFTEAGLGAWADVLKYLPRASRDQLRGLPKLEPEARLAQMLSGDLEPFLQGRMPPQAVVEQLLKDPATRRAFMTLLEELRLRSAQKAKECTREVVANIQQGYLLGRKLYAMRKETESLYATGFGRSGIDEKIRVYSDSKDKCRVALCSTPTRRKSYYDRLIRQHGSLGADLLLVLAVHAIDPFTPDSAILTVRELAWTVDPGRYHDRIGSVMDSLLSLERTGDVRIHPEPAACCPYSWAMASVEHVHAFAAYLESLDFST